MKHMLSDGRSFIADSVQMPTFDDKPEPVRPAAVWLTYAEVLKRLGWSDAEFQQAQAHDFPVAAKRCAPGSWRVTLVWRTDGLDKWVTATREKIATMQTLIKHAKK